MSKDIPIIFSAPMILALLAGRKTMTRRLAWRAWNEDEAARPYAQQRQRQTSWCKVEPGARLWVRETLKRPEQLWRYSADEAKVTCASKHCGDAARWSDTCKQDYVPSIHMPRWASRLTLVVTEAKVERLQDISEEDAIAEGIVGLPLYETAKTANDGSMSIEKLAFAMLWTFVHSSESWHENPEVVALRFAVHEQNIDSMAEAA